MQYDKKRYTLWTVRHPLIWFWVLFPGTILSELILGQRIPKVMLTDKESERTYIPCPHCETLNDGRLWAKWNGFGHWFGYVCPRCHHVIPCLWNIFSLAVLAITFPVWYFPVRCFRRRWLEMEKKRMAQVLERPLIEMKRIHWLSRGVFHWGGLMWVMMVVIPQVWEVFNGGAWDLRMMFIGLFIWIVCGFAWGLWMHLSMNRKGKKADRHESGGSG